MTRTVHDLLTDLIDAARGRADYADARHVRSRVERISTRNGEVDSVDRGDEEGVGIRVRVGGAWGFAATRAEDRPGLEEALARALEIARSQPAAPPEPLVPEPPARGFHESPAQIDPFAIPAADKLELLLAADAAMAGDPRVSVRRAHFLAFSEHKLFASTEGAVCEQRTTECGGGGVAVAVDGDETQVR